MIRPYWDPSGERYTPQQHLNMSQGMRNYWIKKRAAKAAALNSPPEGETPLNELAKEETMNISLEERARRAKTIRDYWTKRRKGAPTTGVTNDLDTDDPMPVDTEEAVTAPSLDDNTQENDPNNPIPDQNNVMPDPLPLPTPPLPMPIPSPPPVPPVMERIVISPPKVSVPPIASIERIPPQPLPPPPAPRSSIVIDDPQESDVLDGPGFIDDSLNQPLETSNSYKSASKELFTSKNVDVKTEVTHDEINNITRLRFLQARYGVRNVEVIIDTFLTLRVSMERKSRKEFIDALQSERREKIGGGFLKKLAGGFGGGGSAGGGSP